MRPTLISAPAAWAAAGSASAISVDDVDEDAALLLDRCGLDDRAQGVRGAPHLADHPAVDLVADRQLEDDRAVLLVELLDGDGVRIIDELPRQVVEQLLHRVLDVGDVDALRAQELADLRGRRGARG